MRAVADLDDIPTDGCVAAGRGRVLLTRAGGRVRAYENRCLHAGARLDRGAVADGVLTCPMHFWRYELADGRVVGGDARLPELDVEVTDGQAVVEVPEPGTTSLRERLLEHARTWQRDR